MSVMKQGMPPAGVNPVPVKVSIPQAALASPKQVKQPDVPSAVKEDEVRQGKCLPHALHSALHSVLQQ